jgi:hypothetical protein
MSSKSNTFPAPNSGDWSVAVGEALTKREAFAIRFAAAIVASPKPPRLVDAAGGQLDMSHPAIIALTAVGLADALIAELAREPQT